MAEQMTCEQAILVEIETGTRDDVAIMYGHCLGDATVNWPKVNRAIMERWSLSALRYVKDCAWKLREGTAR